MKRPLAIVVVAATLLLTGCSPAVDADPGASAGSSETTSPTFDAPIAAGGWMITIHSWDAGEEARSPRAIPAYVAPPQSGKAPAVMSVSLAYTGNGIGNTADVNILYVPDEGGVPSGRKTPLTTAPSPLALAEGRITEGESLTGDIYFETPPDSRGSFRISTPGMEDAITLTP